MGEAIILKRRPSVSYAKDWQYTLNDTTALVTKYIGSETDVVVPNKIRGRNVVLQNSPDSSNGVFTNNRNIVSVQFSDGVKFANSNMSFTFSNCKNLISVTSIPSSLSNMYYTFQDCNSITDAPIIPNSVRVMAGTFLNCINLVNAPVIPSSVTNMSETFFGCYNLVNAPVIPNSVTGMSQTFMLCHSLIDAPVIPNGVTNMYGTFKFCNRLVNAPAIPNGVSTIAATFYSCYNLINAPAIPANVMSMRNTFYGCANLKGNIYIKSNRINNSSMENCFSRTTLPKNVYIPSKGLDATNNTWNAAFNATYGINGKNGVTVYDIGDTTMGQWEYTTNATSALIKKYIGTKTDVVVPYEIDGKNVVLQNSPNSSNGVFTNNKNITSVRFLTDGTKIANSNASNMFTNCSNLKGVSIMPNGVTNMSNAFLNCQNLSEAPYIPNSVTNVCNAFTYCHNLQGIVAIPPSVTNMAYAFYNCNITKALRIFIEPNSLNAATFNGAFALSNVRNVYAYSSGANSTHNTWNWRYNACSAQGVTSSVTNGTVRFEDMNTYANTTYYNKYSSGTNMYLRGADSTYCYVPCKINGYNSVVQESCFHNRTGSVECITFAPGVKFANNRVSCYNDYALRSIKGIPNGITDMYMAFYNCTNLINVPVIPSTVTNMLGTFSWCNTLVNAPIIPNGVTNMGSTFSACQCLVNAPTIPNSVTGMYGTFSGCLNLVNAPIIPNNVTNMFTAFANCVNFKGDIVIKSNRIDGSGLYLCFNSTSLSKNVYIPYTGYNTVLNTRNAAFNSTYGINGRNGVTVYDINTYKGSY